MLLEETADRDQGLHLEITKEVHPLHTQDLDHPLNKIT